MYYGVCGFCVLAKPDGKGECIGSYTAVLGMQNLHKKGEVSHY